MATATDTRRDQLASFLRSRRERVTPQDVGLPPGTRRRTPGLRREEVAQLAGVGVTWYTWLEQGRPINASVQVLDAIARTLRMDSAEREHLYRLADLPEVVEPGADDELDPEIHQILGHLDPVPACVYNSRYDLLAWNAAYAAFFPNLIRQPSCCRNVLWLVFAMPGCCCPILNREQELPQMVAALRGAYARHAGEPAWTALVSRLCAESPEFARMWATHDVARPGSRMKILKHTSAGLIRANSTSLALSSPQETRLVVYSPMDDESKQRIEWVRAHPGTPACEHDVA
ncbi:helix-turn-helix transcriptional regulator [Planotetraspora phitsanulokensis]|uniref:Transcriptional regulator n=1 Tax=Planotetraspora phitsanulokensis TaxID=575192 RepID=A0A8J3ULD2_9ACTN|nr:helix-turn-helix transcriptional regulator [Planotetraspora phitsanulokensis]GII40845.1 transcriptional regulator [Planotetraspora phitsanulokensis]